uniref:Uncharacterized protein n=1 Tax=Cacopsylla melanoneura TaxID=428564 RepID=A0A8D8WXK0_9HEMI
MSHIRALAMGIFVPAAPGSTVQILRGRRIGGSHLHVSHSEVYTVTTGHNVSSLLWFHRYPLLHLSSVHMDSFYLEHDPRSSPRNGRYPRAQTTSSANSLQEFYTGRLV